MRTGTYEAMLIFRPDMDDEKLKGRIEKIRHNFLAKGAVIEREEFIGRRRLETVFQHFRDGYYVLYYFNCDKSLVRDIENFLRISDDVIRYLIVQSEKAPVKEPVPAAPAAAPVAVPVTPVSAPAATDHG